MANSKIHSINLEINKEGIANLVFDLPNEKVNKLSAKVLLELEKILDDAKTNHKIRVLVFRSEKKNIFIAGADINEIKDIKNSSDALRKVTQGQNILNKIEDLPFPTIAFINGACLGGGLELALACRYRIVTDNEKTKLGLPEVNLGIIPGFGGTQRLPKIIGLQQSLPMILSSKAIDAKKAYKIGLADEIVREEFNEKSLSKFFDLILLNPKENQYLTKRDSAKRIRNIKEHTLFLRYVFYYFAKKELMKQTKGHYPAPLAALNVIQKTHGICDYFRNRGLKIEAEHFSHLAIGDISKNLIDLFFISEEIKKDSGAGKEVKIPEINNAALIGAGVMGGGIAWLFSNYDLSVRMKDISLKGIELGFKQVQKIYGQLKKIRKYDDNKINLKTNHITSTTDYKGFENADLVIEAIIEDINIKKKTLAEVENYIAKDAIIASNTSSLSITEMAKVLKNQKRFVGMHFFNPVNRMPLVEVIRGKKTSDQTVAAIVALAKKLGKTPIVVEDVAGFLVNRILIPYINEAGFLISEGADLKIVDDLIVKFGMPMGPFTLADTVGIDVGYKVAKILEEAYGERMKVCGLLSEIAKDKNLLGKKSGQGFFLYDVKGQVTGINPKITEIITNTNQVKNSPEDISGLIKPAISEDDIIDRCIYIMINEAAKCLEEKVVKNAGYLDIAMIMGTGFPAFRGGLLKYTDSIGVREVVSRMKDLYKKYGKRFEPAALLLTMAKGSKRKSFYE